MSIYGVLDPLSDGLDAHRPLSIGVFNTAIHTMGETNTADYLSTESVVGSRGLQGRAAAIAVTDGQQRRAAVRLQAGRPYQMTPQGLTPGTAIDTRHE